MKIFTMYVLSAHSSIIFAYLLCYFSLVASPPGVLTVPLFSTPFKRVLVGDSVQFSYLIALVNSSLNVTSSVFMTYHNSSNGLTENMKLLDQGKDVYTFNIPSATLSMDETIFILEFAGIQIQSSRVTLRVFGM